MNKQFKLRLAAESGDNQTVRQLLLDGVQPTPGVIYVTVTKRHTAVMAEILSIKPHLLNQVRANCENYNCLDWLVDVQTVVSLRPKIGAFDPIIGHSHTPMIKKGPWQVSTPAPIPNYSKQNETKK